MNDSDDCHDIIFNTINNAVTINEFSRIVSSLNSGTTRPENGKLLRVRVVSRILATTALAYAAESRAIY
jgi:hypothetical protein